MRPLLVLLSCLACLTPPALAQLAPPSDELVKGVDSYNRGDLFAAFAYLRAAADRGEAEAMVNLGYMYARGQAIPRDPAYALRLYERAAKLGDAEGMNAIGYRYNVARPPDLDKAIHWYCRAVLLGNPRAMNNVALLFYNGVGMERDRDEARDLWRQSGALGNLNAVVNLAGDTLADPASSLADRGAAIETIHSAALKNSAQAQAILRQRGDTEVFPPALDMQLKMTLEPRNPAPGSSRLCGNLLS